jgi:hypothetical protein
MLKLLSSGITQCILLDVFRRLGGTSVNVYHTTRRHIPEDNNIHSHHRKSRISRDVYCFCNHWFNCNQQLKDIGSGRKLYSL